jgi:hypothetical protein
MYIVAEKRSRWTIASARQRLPKLIALAAREPQAVYRRDKLVATVVSPELGKEIQEARARAQRPLSVALSELRRLCAEEEYELHLPPRRDRNSGFGGGRR